MNRKIDELLEELYSYTNSGIKLGLENMRAIAKAMGSPEKDYKSIHIAGTNGKGSTSTMIEAGLIEKGVRVGKYTSPHIVKFNERIKINGIEISDEDIVKYYNYVKDICIRLNIKATFFEITTAMMFKYFSDKGVEIAVLEVGLGGRYDATNIVNSEVAIITNISYDHMNYLGKDLKSIANEKVGIIKEDTRLVVVGELKRELEFKLKEFGKGYIDVSEKYKSIEYNLDYKNFITNIKLNGKNYNFSLFGYHQVKNFLTAYEVLKYFNISDEIIEKISSRVKWRCRMERFYVGDKIVILDGAHNEEGALRLVDTIRSGYEKKNVIGIISILEDKEYKKMIEIFENGFNKIIFTSILDNKRGLNGRKLYENCKRKEDKLVIDDIYEAYKKGLEMEGEVIVICGSFYLLSSLIKKLELEETVSSVLKGKL